MLSNFHFSFGPYHTLASFIPPNWKAFCSLHILASLQYFDIRTKMATTAPATEEDNAVAPMCGCFEMCFPQQEEVKEEVETKEADGADVAQDDATESSAGPSGSEGNNTDEEEASKASKKRKKKTHRVRRWLASRTSVKSKSKSKEESS